MTTTWRTCLSALTLGLAVAATTATAHAERWPGTTASIGGAIAARVIAVKCAGPLNPAEIAELDSYIDERQSAFMMGNPANQRFSETVFPTIARDYDRAYSNRDACTAASRDMVRDMLMRVRTEVTNINKQAQLRQ